MTSGGADVEHEDALDELRPGETLMQGQYTIERFLAAGGFGITYLARDSLDRRVVVKECFPGAFCRRTASIVQARSRAHSKELRSIIKLFVQEARSLAKMEHPNIVGVHNVFEENGTAYMALDHVDGEDLLTIMETGSRQFDPETVEAILRQMLEAVGYIHAREMLHRDVSPDNIIVRPDGTPVLIDFGAAREHVDGGKRAMTALRVVKDGYSPQEFYVRGGAQGPSSDLYALAATFYHVVSSEVPPDSQTRLSAIAEREPDPYRPLEGRIEGYVPAFLAAIDDAMALAPADRIPSAEAWSARIGTDAPAADAEAMVARARRPLPLMAAGIGAVALLAGAGILLGTDDPFKAGPGPVAANASTVPTATIVAPSTAPAARALLSNDQSAAFGSVRDEVLPRPAAAGLPSSAEVDGLVEDVKRSAIAEAPQPVGAGPVALATAPRSDGPAAPDWLDAPSRAALSDALAAPGIDAFAAVPPPSEPRPDEAAVARRLGMATAWTVDLPSGVAFEDAADGTSETVVAVADRPVDGRDAFDRALRAAVVPDDDGTVSVPVRLRGPDGAERSVRWRLPALQRTVFVNGLSFEAVRDVAGGWTTRVDRVPAAFAEQLRPGDVLRGNAATGERAEGRMAVSDLIVAASERAESRIPLAVERDGKIYGVFVPFGTARAELN